MMKNLVPVILSGGAGTRLWPQSRESMPKQFVKLHGERTLFETTLARMASLGARAGIVVSNEEHRFVVAEQLRVSEMDDYAILLEPCSRNTAPAIAVAAMQALEHDPSAVLFIAPADHLFDDETALGASLGEAIELAERGKIVTFGIRPSKPHTGYGYIRADASDPSRVAEFVEKPDQENAELFIQDGGYLWNSGMFVVKADVYLSELKAHAVKMHDACRQAWEERARDGSFVRLATEPFFRCPADSVDFAVMERTAGAAVVELDCEWSDLGSWESVWEASEKDASDNAVAGPVELLESCGNYVRTEDKLVTLIGCENLVVVDSGDALLVADRAQSQNVKELVNRLKRQRRTEATTHARVYRPWGNYEGVDKGERYQVKRIVVQPGEVLSLQKHHHRAEHWIVVRGVALVTCDDERRQVNENESTYIPLGSVHRMENPGKIPLELIEVQSGSYLGEDDIIRIEDKYGRRPGDADAAERAASAQLRVVG